MAAPPARAGRLALGCAKVIDAVSAVLVGAITVLVFAQVIVRYVLGGSLVWSEELTRVLFIWMVLVAATTAAPMRIDVLVNALPSRAAAFTALLGEGVVFGLTSYLVWGAWSMADLTWDDRFTALGLSVSWVYIALLVSGTLWLVTSLFRARVHMSQAFGRRERTP